MATPMKAFYTARATATGDGRNGHVATDDGLLVADLQTPKPGTAPEKTNPEQLFAAGYAACFHSALKMAGRKLNLEDSTVDSEVGIGMNLKGGFQLKVTLHVTAPHADQAALEEAVAKAEKTCPYSNATRGNISTTVTANGAKVALAA